MSDVKKWILSADNATKMLESSSEELKIPFGTLKEILGIPKEDEWDVLPDNGSNNTMLQDNEQKPYFAHDYEFVSIGTNIKRKGRIKKITIEKDTT
jgi:hypothetical protein